ncbi:MAG: hypothetical protein WC966_05625 [Bradymonadales bacterium]|jgi:hypothetical protein
MSKIELYFLLTEQAAAAPSCNDGEAILQKQLKHESILAAKNELIQIIESKGAEERLQVFDERLRRVYAVTLQRACYPLLFAFDAKLQELGYPWVYSNDIDELLSFLLAAAQTADCKNAVIKVKTTSPELQKRALDNLDYLSERGIPANIAERLKQNFDALILESERCPELKIVIDELLGAVEE